MKYFTHETSDRNKIASKLIRSRFGAEGYGIYQALIEVIGEEIEKNNMKDWGYVNKMHTVETLAEECSTTPDRMKEFLQFCDEKGIFQKKDGRLYSDMILERLDNYTSRLRSNYVETTDQLPHNRINRIEQNNVEEKRVKREEKQTIPQKAGSGTESPKTKFLKAARKLGAKVALVLLLLFLPLPALAKTFSLTYSFKTTTGRQLATKPISKTVTRSMAGSGFMSTALSEVPNDEEWAIISKYPNKQLIAHIYKYESNFGRADICRLRGGFNGWGMGETGKGPNCFPTFEAVVKRVNDWIEEHKYLSYLQMGCLYITGRPIENCSTSYKFNSNL